MHKRMMTVVRVIALVALLGVVAVGVASAEGPWWMEDDFECLEDCPYDGEPQFPNFVDENDDGINDNAPGMGGRWDSDENYESFGRHAGRGYSGQDRGQFQMPCFTEEDFGPGMMGRWEQNDGNVGPGAGMGRSSQ